MKDRIELLEYCNNKYPNGIVVEIGVASGCFTKQILASYPLLSKLYMIDSWQYQKEGYEDSCNLPQETQDERYNQILKDFTYEPRAIPVRAWSLDAVNNFENQTIDFLYLDANHSYEACIQDLTAWYPKVKKGGIFAGHDYMEGNGRGHGVKKAVDEFAEKHGLKINTTQNEYSRETGVYGATWEGISFYFEAI